VPAVPACASRRVAPLQFINHFDGYRDVPSKRRRAHLLHSLVIHMSHRLKPRDFAVERLRWTLLAALSGVTVGMVGCAGRSESAAETGDAGESNASGGSSSGSGGTAGSVASGGSGNAPGTGGTANSGGSGGSAGGRIIGCAAAAPYGEESNGLVSCENGWVHREEAQACSVPDRYGPEESTAGAGGSEGEAAPPLDQPCNDDFDCDAQPNGFCVEESTPPLQLAAQCSYACTEDSDCGESEICACGSPHVRAANGEGIWFGVCRPATCSTDGDCNGQLCSSPVFAFCGIARPVAFHCQTPEDECAGPDDCPRFHACQHDGTRLVCREQGVCGRPFVVDGVARTASLANGRDWCALCDDLNPAELSSEERAAVTRHFCDAGLMEHASIAAFARFSLQLLALGAPAELVEETTRAIEDETRHAKICFGVAARYGDRAFGPGKLELTGALEALDLLGVADLVITEGCLGETSAALEAAWAAEAAEPALAQLLRGIADDELRHAALAFRFVAWAAAQDARVTELFSRRLHEARAAAASTRASADATGSASERLARHGVLDELTRREARRRALDEIVDPTALALVAC
jgi:hypothetical protein